MVLISDLFDMDMYDEMLRAGFIKVQHHPDHPDALALASYTHKCQQNYHWNAVTEQCRGLIFNPVTLQVVARPFRKFYNFGETEADKIAAQENVTAFDKLDGSLGIAYPVPGTMNEDDGYEEYAIATRGSFSSEQALWATKYVQARRHNADTHNFPFIPGYTDMFEIIYPDNRIVVGYGGRESVTYLGTVDVESGAFKFEDDMFDDRTPVIYRGTFEGVLTLPQRDNAEGVVAVTRDGRRVKVKQEEYVRLHRIVSNLTEKYVWEAMGGPDLLKARKIATDIPEEHAAWLLEVAERLVCEYIIQGSQVNELEWNTKAMKTRKERAIFVQKSGYPKHIQSAYFARIDGKPSIPILWKSVQPKENKEGVQVDD